MNLYKVLVAGVLSLAVSLIVGPYYIKFLHAKKLGQEIRVDGPEKHHVKEGTPTLGGILIISSALLAYAILGKWLAPTKIAIFVTLALALLGFLDDFSKLSKRRSLGLKARWKLLWQAVIVVILGHTAIQYVEVQTVIHIPILAIEANISYFYYFFLFIIVAGMANAVNLTDGLDGLAVGISATTLLAFTGIAFLHRQQDLAVFSAALTGACIGFLWFNCFPAQIFMGDTGSLALGGAIGTIAILSKTKMLLVLLGGMFVIETLSVIIQVIVFRFTGKRVFRMAPIHHHFELQDWPESKIIVRFWIMAGALSAVGFTLYYYFYLHAGR